MNAVAEKKSISFEFNPNAENAGFQIIIHNPVWAAELGIDQMTQREIDTFIDTTRKWSNEGKTLSDFRYEDDNGKGCIRFQCDHGL